MMGGPFVCRVCGDKFKLCFERDHHLKTHPFYFDEMVYYMSQQIVKLQNRETAMCKEIIELKSRDVIPRQQVMDMINELSCEIVQKNTPYTMALINKVFGGVIR